MHLTDTYPFLITLFVLFSFRMALGAGCRRFFRLIFFVESFVTFSAVHVKRLGMIFQLLLFGQLLFAFFRFWRFIRNLVALDTLLNRIALFQVRKGLVIFVVMTDAAAFLV